MNRLQISLPVRNVGQDVVIAVDSTGVKVTRRGEWLRRKWNGRKYRGWLKVHIAVDVKSGEVLALGVTNERVHDAHMLPRLVEQAEAQGVRISAVIGDGAYYTNSTYNYLHARGIKAVIKPRRQRHKIPRLALPGTMCKRGDGYGHGAVEEQYDNMLQEITLQYTLLNMMMGCAQP